MSDAFAPQNATAERNFAISDSARTRLLELIEKESAGAMLRVSVSGGGCSGFQYGFTFDANSTPDDHLFEKDGVAVVVDDVSLDLLNGAELDFVVDLIGASFQIKNPNATASCGCGASFSV